MQTPTQPAPFPQSGVLPYRLVSQQLEILLITSRRRNRWVIPKGIVEPRLSAEASAIKEAFEEAGIRGTITTAMLGSYHYQKWGYLWTVSVFGLAVDRLEGNWPEMRSRQRQWYSLADAQELLEEPELRMLVSNLPQVLAHDQGR